MKGLGSISKVNACLEVTHEPEEFLVAEGGVRHLFYEFDGAVASEVLGEFSCMFLRDEFVLCAVDDQARALDFLCTLFVIEALLEQP